MHYIYRYYLFLITHLILTVMHYNIYFDETCKNDNFFIYGGCIFADDIKESIDRNIQNVSKELGIHSNEEVKWTKTNRKKLELHKYIIDIFFENMDKNKTFALMVGINNKCVYTKEYRASNSPTDFLGKLIHNLLKYDLFKYSLIENQTFSRWDKFSLFLDHDTIIKEDQIRIASYAINSEFSKLLFSESDSNFFIRNTDCVNSKNHRLLQISDLIMGGIGYLVNNKYKNSEGQPKYILAMYLLEKLIERGIFMNLNSLKTGNKPWENRSFSFRVFKPCLSKKSKKPLKSIEECKLRDKSFGCK